MDWCIVQLRKSGRVGIGLYGKIIIGGIQEWRYLVWLPHLGPLEQFGERHRQDTGKWNYLTVKPENVESTIEVSHDNLTAEAAKIWAKN